MADPVLAKIDAFLTGEYLVADAAMQSGQIELAWHHLQRAHIVAQRRLLPHCRSHWKMLTLAIRTGDLKEVLGQIVRLALAPLGNITGRIPVGNTGRANVSAFAQMDIPHDIQSILQSTTDFPIVRRNSTIDPKITHDKH